MIALAGLEVDKDIRIKITGLRPGEKLHEELLSSKEALLKTHHPKIRRAQTADKMNEAEMEKLHALLNDRGNHKATMEVLMALLPEYSGTPFHEPTDVKATDYTFS